MLPVSTIFDVWEDPVSSYFLLLGREQLVDSHL